MEHSKTVSSRGEDPNSLSFQFITENGSGKRAQRSSAAMHAIRSQARKHGLLERQRRHAASQGLVKDRFRSLQVASEKAHIHPSMHIPHAKDCSIHTCHACFEGANSSSQDVDPRKSRQLPYRLMETQDAQAEYGPGIHAPSGRVCEAGRNHKLQRQMFQRIGPQTRLGAGRVDPFQCYPIRAEPYIHNLVDHYITLCKRNTAALLLISEMVAIRPGEAPATNFDWVFTGWVSLAFTHPLTFRSLLLIAEADLQVSSGLDPWSFRAIDLSLECARLLQEEIRESKEVSDTTMGTVINIAFMELVFSRDCERYRSHMMEGLGKMISLRGGMDKLPGYMQNIIIWVSKVADDLWESGQADKEEPNCLFHPWWKPNYGELMAST
ncbi:hypothetical protein N431DRAFT_166662 [Stipitochalara longipes BDJ]|nr:hypothetical protein N431DRAFT_166662 [Stipitochalara longipes BDJ]